MDMLNWALRYYHAGLPIMPVLKKEAILKNWQHITHEKLSEEIIRNWFSRSGMNIGLVCGKDSGITVVDCDWLKDRDGNILYKESENPASIAARLPFTLSSVTGTGGVHKFFRFTDIKNSTKTVHPQIDIKSEGGYVILPPSVHPKTRVTYAWHELTAFDESNLGDNLAEVPEWIIEASERANASKDYDAIIAEVTQGSRNTTAAMLSGRVIYALRFAPQIAWEFMQWWNANKTKPPLPELELWNTFQSILKRDIKNNPSKYGER